MATPAEYGVIGSSPLMQRAIERLELVSPTELTVLITGESGTGKEVFARAIHHLSRRRRQRLVSVNCGAIPENLLEAELFGNEKGAFTGAVEQRKGFFETADRGTIFLDELGEMPLATQVKLLRVLESGEFSRLGSSDVLKVDVRVVAATNRRLEEEVRLGHFRRDLYYRLNAVQIQLPPLREHPQDVPALVEFFAQRTSEKTGIPYHGISDEALQLLMNLPWLGNVRELRNTVETLVTLERGKYITPEVARPYISLMLPEAASPPHLLHHALPPHEPQHTSNHHSHHELNHEPDAEFHDISHEDVFTVDPEAARALVHVPGRTSEQVERELVYKAMIDMAQELASLREEIAGLKDAVYSQQQRPMAIVPSAEHSQSLVPMLPVELDDASLRLEAMEQKLIVAALERHSGNRRLAAQSLGVSERTLYRKLHEYNLLERFP